MELIAYVYCDAKIDISGTVGDEAWRNLRQFEEMEAASFGLRCGSGAVCNRPAGTPHLKGEWISADM